MAETAVDVFKLIGLNIPLAQAWMLVNAVLSVGKKGMTAKRGAKIKAKAKLYFPKP